MPQSLEFTYEAAYKVLLRFRSRPDVPQAFQLLANTDTWVTDVERHQVVLAKTDRHRLISHVYNFSHQTYDDLFNGICALCSSATPMITVHEMVSLDDKIFQAFDDSNLGLYGSYTKSQNGVLWMLKAKINYPG